MKIKFLTEGQMENEFVNEKLRAIMPKLEQFFQKSSNLQHAFHHSNVFFDKEGEKKLWQQIEMLISFEEQIENASSFIKRLKIEAEDAGRINQRLLSEIDLFADLVRRAFIYCSVLEQSLAKMGIAAQ